MERKHRDRAVLDFVRNFRPARVGDFKVEVKLRYSNQNVAVLGAGLSGAAAALLLKAEGANVTGLDSADENKLLKSTIDNLRAQDIRVICGAAADQDSAKYDFVVASPGIDPTSALAQNFSARSPQDESAGADKID